MTRRQQWALFILGAWFVGTVLSAVMAAENFYTIDRLLQNSSNATFRQTVEKLGHAAAHDFLFYLSAELNRLYFQWWNIAELALLLLALWLVRPLPGSKKAVWGIVAMLAVVIFMTVALTPPIVSVGRALDFVPRDPPPPALRTFGLLHAAFSVFTLINLVLGVLVTLWIQKANTNDKRTHPASL
jgi:hypothetical protein